MGRRTSEARPSPAIILAVFALVAAVAGTAVADPDAVTSALSKKKVKKLVKKEVAKQIENATGPPGPPGPPGADGPRGSAAASAFTARINGPPASGPPEYFGAVSGISSGETANDDPVTTRSPNATTIARDLSVRYAEPIFVTGNAGWRLRLLVNGAPTSLACAIRGTATACNSGGTAVTVPPGSALAFRAEQIPDGSFFPIDPDLEIGWRATTP